MAERKELTLRDTEALESIARSLETLTEIAVRREGPPPKQAATKSEKPAAPEAASDAKKTS